MALKLPSEILNLKANFWKLQYADKEIKYDALLRGTTVAGYFYTDLQRPGVVCTCKVSDKRTSTKTKYPRAELREMDSKGEEIKWDANKGVHYLWTEGYWDHIPKVKRNLVAAQIHSGAADELEVLTTIKNGSLCVTLRILNDSVKDIPALANIKEGAYYKIFVLVISGTVYVYYNDFTKPAYSYKLKTKDNYFKCGAYVNSNTDTEKGNKSEYGQVCITKAEVFHGTSVPKTVPVRGWPGAPTGPVDPKPPIDVPPSPPEIPPTKPTPTEPPKDVKPTGKAVILTRHVEKDDNKDGKEDVLHEPSKLGTERSKKIAWQFTRPEAQLAARRLYGPRICFASKGTSKAMRMRRTVEPTANAFKPPLPIVDTLDSEIAIPETTALLKQLASLHGVVLAALEHEVMIPVAKGFGKLVGEKLPTKWPEDRFDIYFVLVELSDGSWLFYQVPHMLMTTDSSRPIK